ncbi:MAG: hypothetical protein ACI8PT_002972, partial [Gammaproteobacteria bacterium]
MPYPMRQTTHTALGEQFATVGGTARLNALSTFDLKLNTLQCGHLGVDARAVRLEFVIRLRS